MHKEVQACSECRTYQLLEGLQGVELSGLGKHLNCSSHKLLPLGLILGQRVAKVNTTIYLLTSYSDSVQSGDCLSNVMHLRNAFG